MPSVMHWNYNDKNIKNDEWVKGNLACKTNKCRARGIITAPIFLYLILPSLQSPTSPFLLDGNNFRHYNQLIVHITPHPLHIYTLKHQPYIMCASRPGSHIVWGYKDLVKELVYFCEEPQKSPLTKLVIPLCFFSTLCSSEGYSTWLRARSKNSGLWGMGR